MNKEYVFLGRMQPKTRDYIKNLERENRMLEHNWNELKQYCLDEQIPEEYEEYNSYIEFSNSAYQNILNRMEKLEEGGNNE
jgi:hypothetical protein